MAQIKWLNGSNGDFATASNWSTDTVPGPSDVAAINAKGTYTVTSSIPETVLALTTSSTATLDLTTQGPFTAITGTGTGANAGTINVGFVRFIVGGTVTNTGTISLNAGSDNSLEGSDLIINSDTVLRGGGKITLADAVWSNLSDFPNHTNNTGSSLTNVNDDISGAGVINVQQLINEKHGVIDANGSHALYLFPDFNPGTVVNAGILEATGTGGMLLQYNVIENSGQLIANNGVLIAEGAVTGKGTALIEGTGMVEFDAASSAATTFAKGSTGELILKDATQFTGTVAGLSTAPGASIDLENIAFAAGPTVNFNARTHLLTVSAAGTTDTIKIVGTGTFTANRATDGSTLITDPPPPQISHDSAQNEVLVSNGSFVFNFGNGHDKVGPTDQSLNDHIDVLPSALHDLSQLSAAFEIATHESTMTAGHDVSLHQSHMVLASHDFILK
jgi:hypothetical protein